MPLEATASAFGSWLELWSGSQGGVELVQGGLECFWHWWLFFPLCGPELEAIEPECLQKCGESINKWLCF